MRAPQEEPSSGPGRSVALDLVSQVQVLGLASAAAVAERYVGSLDRQGDRRFTDRTVGQGRGARDGAADRLELAPVGPGGRAVASLWVHNPTSAPVEVTLRAGALVCAEGAVLPAGSVVVEPRGPVTVAPGGSAEHRVVLLVPGATAPGHYHGVITSTATPHQALPVHLEVLHGEVRP